MRICLTYASARLAEPGKADRTGPQASCRTFKNQSKIGCFQRNIYFHFVFKSLEGPKRTLRFGGTPVAKSSICRFGVEIVSEIKGPPKPLKNFGRGASGQSVLDKSSLNSISFIAKHITGQLNLGTCITFSHCPAEVRRGKSSKIH